MTVESWRKTPTQEMMWYPSAEYYPNNWWFTIYFALFHYLPALLLDLYLLLSGQRHKWVNFKDFSQIQILLEFYLNDIICFIISFDVMKRPIP